MTHSLTDSHRGPCVTVRKGWHPLFVDLDLGQGGITCPATVGAVPVKPFNPKPVVNPYPYDASFQLHAGYAGQRMRLKMYFLDL